MSEFADRHPATVNLLRQFRYDHLPAALVPVGSSCASLAYQMVDDINDGPELSFALRQLLVATDAFIRAAMDSAA